MGSDLEGLLASTARYAMDYRASLPTRSVRAAASVDELRAALGGPLPEAPTDPATVVEDLIRLAEPGVIATGSPRYFGFVIGGALPAALAADWLTSTWDQNAGLVAGGPSAAVVEEVAGAWLVELLGLPSSSSFALVTGCQMAHVTALAAARHHVLEAHGWDLERDGLCGSPPIRVIAGDQRHATVDRALRLLGIGRSAIVTVTSDAQWRLTAAAVTAALADLPPGPTIVCAQVGEVNTGAMDEVAGICAAAHERRAWVHVDGAFGLWAAAAPGRRHLVAGVERADSWATDCHKWLNVPYDCGLAVCAHSESHRAAMGTRAAYLVHESASREAMDWTPEFSRRARGWAVYAALRSLGRVGVAELVERCCANAARFADALCGDPRVQIDNEVLLDQVLVRFRSPDGDDDALTRRVIAAVQDEGTCWMSGTTVRGHAAMRISVVNFETGPEDIDRSARAVLDALDRVGDVSGPA
ncbi:MAG: pyridoxal phosphate-dependent decarboxylase family protein [Acidimicrobiales bacterium]